MNDKREFIDFLPVILMGCLFVLIIFLALLMSVPFKAAGEFAFENPDDPLNLAYFFFTLIFFTVLILLISKFWKKRAVQVIVLAATGLLYLYVFYPLMVTVVPDQWCALSLSIATALILLIMLVKNPEWYLIDLSGVITSIGAIAILGISLNVFLVIVLLVGLSIYDAISVYKTKHMIDLADTMVELRLPIMFVIPKKRNYSLFGEKKSLKEKLREGEERDAFLMGLGDVVFPGILAVSAFHNLSSDGFLLSLSVIIGSLLGFALLMIFVMKGKPQAGLPYLCSGAILGYLISSYIFL